MVRLNHLSTITFARRTYIFQLGLLLYSDRVYYCCRHWISLRCKLQFSFQESPGSLLLKPKNTDIRSQQGGVCTLIFRSLSLNFFQFNSGNQRPAFWKARCFFITRYSLSGITIASFSLFYLSNGLNAWHTMTARSTFRYWTTCGWELETWIRTAGKCPMAASSSFVDSCCLELIS